MRVAVALDHRVTDRDDLQRLAVVGHHRQRVSLEQQTVPVLAGLQPLLRLAQRRAEGEAETAEYHRDRREADRDRAELVRVSDDQDDEARAGHEPGQDEPRQLLPAKPSRTTLADPHRHREHQQRCRPRNAVEDAPEIPTAAGEVEGVSGRVDRQSDGDQPERRAAPAGHDHAAAGDDPEEQQVPDRVGEAGGRAKRSTLEQMLESVERETGTECRHAERRDRAVQPVGSIAALELAAHEQHDGGQGDREEPEVERIGQRGVCGRRPAERFERQHQIAGRPREARAPHRQRDPAVTRSAEPPREAQRAGDHFEADDQPAIEPRRELVGATEDEKGEVGDQ